MLRDPERASLSSPCCAKSPNNSCSQHFMGYLDVNLIDPHVSDVKCRLKEFKIDFIIFFFILIIACFDRFMNDLIINLNFRISYFDGIYLYILDRRMLLSTKIRILGSGFDLMLE